MGKIIHKSETRGYFNHGWLKTHHTFSFAGYYNESRIHFGALRVFNDDWIEAGTGFDTHPHNNMEIITIPLSGSLFHRDSMGFGRELVPGEVQVMTAGHGIFHSEFNSSKTDPLTLLQIWIFPEKKDIEPRYDQKFFPEESRQNQIQLLVSGDSRNESLLIHQNAFISRLCTSQKKTFEYTMYDPENLLYIFIIDGNAEILGESLKKRDGIGISESEKIKIQTFDESDILFLEVPPHSSQI